LKTYITEIVKKGRKYAGQRIRASSWKNAEKQAAKQGTILVGELA
jgi:hypothetical protein